MEMKHYRLYDPTGGGDDGTLILPVWAVPQVGDEIEVSLPGGEIEHFEIGEEARGDDE